MSIKQKLTEIMKQLEEEEGEGGPEPEGEGAPEPKKPAEGGDDNGNGEGEPEKGVSVDVLKVADRIGDRLVAAISEAKGGLAQTDRQDLKNKFYSPKTGMRGIVLPEVSALENLGKDDKIAVWFKSMVMRAGGDLEADRVFKALVEGTDAQGGYLVPEEFATEVYRILPDAAVMRKLATILPMNTDTLNLNTLEARPYAYWTSEYASKSTTSAEFGRVTLQPNDLVCLLPITHQLVADANINIVQFVTKLFVEAIANAEDAAFFTGSGTGQPQGITNCSGVSTHTAGGVLDFDDLINALYQMPQAVRNSASSAWVANRRVIRILHQVKDSQNRYLWTPMASSEVIGKRVDHALGYPVYEQNNLSEDQLWFGDWSYYIIGDRQQIVVETTREGGDAWRRNAIEVKAVERVDGECVKAGAFMKISGIQS